MIKTLIVDDSAIVCAMLKQVMQSDGRFTVVGTAENGEKAIAKNRELEPDIIVMDINMPIMDGLTATEAIMKESNPIIVIFSTEDSAKVSYRCIEVGALDIVRKPDFASMSSEELSHFCDKLALIASFPHNKRKSKAKGVHSTKMPSQAHRDLSLIQETKKEVVKEKRRYKVLLIGSSTGGPSAVQTVLRGLGSDFPLPILITQHIDSQFDAQFAEWLNSTVDLPVKLASDGEIPKAGQVYIAPANVHLIVVSGGKKAPFILSLNQDMPVNFLRPAVDKLFLSAANLLGSSTLAILLTGMGRDGANGCKEIVNVGGTTICESEKTCIVFGMPKAAIDCGGASFVFPLEQIPQEVKKLI